MLAISSLIPAFSMREKESDVGAILERYLGMPS